MFPLSSSNVPSLSRHSQHVNWQTSFTRTVPPVPLNSLLHRLPGWYAFAHAQFFTLPFSSRNVLVTSEPMHPGANVGLFVGRLVGSRTGDRVGDLVGRRVGRGVVTGAGVTGG